MIQTFSRSHLWRICIWLIPIIVRTDYKISVRVDFHLHYKIVCVRMITDETRNDYIGALDLLDIKSTLRPSMPRYDRLTKDAAIKKLDTILKRTIPRWVFKRCTRSIDLILNVIVQTHKFLSWLKNEYDLRRLDKYSVKWTITHSALNIEYINTISRYRFDIHMWLTTILRTYFHMREMLVMFKLVQLNTIEGSLYCFIIYILQQQPKY